MRSIEWIGVSGLFCAAPLAIAAGVRVARRLYPKQGAIWREAERRTFDGGAAPLHAVVVDVVVMPREDEKRDETVRVRLPGIAADARFCVRRTPGPDEFAPTAQGRTAAVVGRDGDDVLISVPLCSKSVVRIEAISVTAIGEPDVRPESGAWSIVRAQPAAAPNAPPLGPAMSSFFQFGFFLLATVQAWSSASKREEIFADAAALGLTAAVVCFAFVLGYTGVVNARASRPLARAAGVRLPVI